MKIQLLFPLSVVIGLAPGVVQATDDFLSETKRLRGSEITGSASLDGTLAKHDPHRGLQDGDPIPGAYIVQLDVDAIDSKGEGRYKAIENFAKQRGVTPNEIYTHSIVGFAVKELPKGLATFLEGDENVLLIEQDRVVRLSQTCIPANSHCRDDFECCSNRCTRGKPSDRTCVGPDPTTPPTMPPSPLTNPPTNQPTTSPPTNQPTTNPPTNQPTTNTPTNQPTNPPTNPPTTNPPTTNPPTTQPPTNPPTNPAPSTQETPYGITRVGGGATYTGDNVAWILDTGIDLDHHDLNVDVSRAWSAFGDNGNDIHSHGTHVAGTIAAIDNGYGVIGVAAGATVIPVKVLGDTGSGSWSGIIAGIDYVAANGKSGDVANMSLSGGKYTTVNNAVIAAAANSGVFFSLAAGNDNANADNYSPASANGINVMTISAMDSSDRMASFSNFGPSVDGCQPGVSTLSTIPGNSYGRKSGTSMAAPHMGGVMLMSGSASCTFADRVLNDKDLSPDPICIIPESTL